MALPTGRYRLGTESGRIVLRTFRDGLAATAGHDLVIELPRWSGELVVDDDKTPESLEVRIDLGALTVVEGSGGLKPLTDRDRREIATTARRALSTDQHPEAVFTANRFEMSGDNGVIEGNLSIRGVTRPLRLQVSQTEPGQLPGHRDAGAVGLRDQALHRVLRCAEGAGRSQYRGKCGHYRVRRWQRMTRAWRGALAEPGRGAVSQRG